MMSPMPQHAPQDSELIATALIEARKMLDQQSATIAQLTPKATRWDAYLSDEGDMSVAEAAKSLARSGIDIGRNRLFDILDRPRGQGGLGWCFRNSDGLHEPYQSQVNLGRIYMRTGHYGSTLRITTKGLDAIAAHVHRLAVAS